MTRYQVGDFKENRIQRATPSLPYLCLYSKIEIRSLHTAHVELKKSWRSLICNSLSLIRPASCLVFSSACFSPRRSRIRVALLRNQIIGISGRKESKDWACLSHGVHHTPHVTKKKMMRRSQGGLITFIRSVGHFHIVIKWWRLPDACQQAFIHLRIHSMIGYSSAARVAYISDYLDSDSRPWVILWRMKCWCCKDGIVHAQKGMAM